MSDEVFMAEAIKVASKARLIAPPNPWVGCVIVRDEKVVGRGHTQAVGQPHAEVMALKEAGEVANGATAYVTLEPCCHWGRTPPCTDALIAAGIRRVVVAIEDPDTRVSGQGIRLLKNSGVWVTTGILADAVQNQLRPYLFQRKHKRPYVLLKGAISLDGRLAAQDYTSQWITGPKARADAHRLRAESQAILVGSGTAIADSPALTVRHGALPPKPPLRILLDRRGRTPPSGPLFDQTLAPTLIFTSTETEHSIIDRWLATGVQVEQIPTEQQDSLSLREVLKSLHQRQVVQLLVEGGATLFSAFVQQQLAQQLTICLGPCLLGEKGLPLFSQLPISTIHEAPRLDYLSHELFDDCMRIDYLFTDVT